MNRVQDPSIVRDIQKPDVQSAAKVLASAFRGYPFFEYCLGDADNYERMAPKMFASFVSWTMLYGKAWATSDLNAVALRRPPGTRSIGFWNALRSGLAFSFFADGPRHETTIQCNNSDRHGNPQADHGRSASLALLDDGRAARSPRYRRWQTTDAIHVRTERSSGAALLSRNL